MERTIELWLELQGDDVEPLDFVGVQRIVIAARARAYPDLPPQR